jgi:hypothetical protein
MIDFEVPMFAAPGTQFVGPDDVRHRYVVEDIFLKGLLESGVPADDVDSHTRTLLELDARDAAYNCTINDAVWPIEFRDMRAGERSFTRAYSRFTIVPLGPTGWADPAMTRFETWLVFDHNFSGSDATLTRLYVSHQDMSIMPRLMSRHLEFNTALIKYLDELTQRIDDAFKVRLIAGYRRSLVAAV